MGQFQDWDLKFQSIFKNLSQNCSFFRGSSSMCISRDVHTILLYTSLVLPTVITGVARVNDITSARAFRLRKSHRNISWLNFEDSYVQPTPYKQANLWSDRRAIAADRICPGVTGQTLCYLTTELGSTRPGSAPFTSIKRFGACSHKENDGRGCPKEKWYVAGKRAWMTCLA